MPAKTKGELRAELEQAYTKHELADYQKSFVELIERNTVFQDASHVLGYRPMRDEIPFLEPLRQRHPDKKWFFPAIESHQFVESVSQALWAPSTETRAVLIAPARGATLNGDRLGRGGGWYDRFLSLHSEHVHSLCVIPAFALLKELPIEKYDQSISEILVATST